jgi:hypothetical protein
MLSDGTSLLLAKARAVELQREADRNHRSTPARPRMLGLLLRRRISRPTRSR